MVFQSYGLYPHLTVWNNIAFPLRTQGTARPEIKRKVEWAAGLLGIGHLAQRRPRELSGGERQRVALARALVRDPTVFLLDEPLSNLDAKLRASARSELKQFQRTVRTATIYVTHDQVEAMGMGDRIAVIDHGKLRQVGTPTEIYEHPADEFVASFLGTPPMNLIEREGGSMGFRPENFLPKELLNGTAVVEFPFRVDRVEYLGSEHILYGALDGRAAKREVTAKLPAHATLNGISPGAWHAFAVRETELRYFDRDGRNTQRPLTRRYPP
jgi:multiple sugar transport system ATP-binding protein